MTTPSNQPNPLGVPTDLWTETPEALAFCKLVISDLEKYKNFEDEVFIKVSPGIPTSTALDSQGQAFSSGDLEKYVGYVRDHVCWLTVLHDPLIPPIGRVIAADIFFAPQSNIYFVAAVLGYYDLRKLKRFEDFQISTSDIPFEDAPSDIPADTPFGHALIAYSPHEIEAGVIAELLNDSPPLIDRSPIVSIRRDADPLTILSIVISVFALATNPFSAKFLERFGDKAAQETIALLSWLSNKVFRRIASFSQKRVLFVFLSNHKGC